MNRKQVLSSVTIAAIATILLAWAPSTAYAGVFVGPEATVIMDFGCSLAPDDGGPGFTTESHSVENKNFTKLTCHFTGLPFTDQAQIFKGFLCNTFAGLTTDSMSVVDDEGNGMLRCIIHK